MVGKLSTADEKVLTRINVDRDFIIVDDVLGGLMAGRKIALIEMPDATMTMLFGRGILW